MFAVVESGSKQYKVEPGQRIKVDKLAGEVNDAIILDKVLMVVDGESVQVGQPLVDGTVVRATILEEVKGDKIIVFKYKPKKRYRKTMGFRSRLTTIRIDGIGASEDTNFTTKATTQESVAPVETEVETNFTAKATTQESVAPVETEAEEKPQLEVKIMGKTADEVQQGE